MSTLFAEIGIYSYEGYLKMFEHWAQNLQSSKPDASEALIEYTRLNWVRTQRIHKTILLNPELEEAVKKIQHNYSWLVLTEAWCGDSAQNLPVIAEIAKLNPEKIKLYILLRDENPGLMDKYLTNGSRAIPKLVAINETLSKEAFIWGPRPAPARELLNNWKRDPAARSRDEFEKNLHGWYAKDKANTLQAEFLELVRKLD